MFEIGLLRRLSDLTTEMHDFIHNVNKATLSAKLYHRLINNYRPTQPLWFRKAYQSWPHDVPTTSPETYETEMPESQTQQPESGFGIFHEIYEKLTEGQVVDQAEAPDQTQEHESIGFLQELYSIITG